jgi:hypothetical protein
MNKSLITAATFLLLSTASFAATGSPGDGVDTDPPWVFDHKLVRDNAAKKHLFDNGSATEDALKIEGYDQMETKPNYINNSQLR